MVRGYDLKVFSDDWGRHPFSCQHIMQHFLPDSRVLYDSLSHSASVALFLAKFEGKIIAAGISVKYGDKAWLLYAASDCEYYKLKPNRTVQWEMVLWAHRGGCHRYDFRGTATCDPPIPMTPVMESTNSKKVSARNSHDFWATMSWLSIPHYIHYFDLLKRRNTPLPTEQKRGLMSAGNLQDETKSDI